MGGHKPSEVTPGSQPKQQAAARAQHDVSRAAQKLLFCETAFYLLINARKQCATVAGRRGYTQECGNTMEIG